MTMSHQIENVYKEIEIIIIKRKNQMEILELKSTLAKI